MPLGPHDGQGGVGGSHRARGLGSRADDVVIDEEDAAGRARVIESILLQLGHGQEAIASAAAAAAAAETAAETAAMAATSAAGAASKYLQDPVLPGNRDAFGAPLDNFDLARQVADARSKSAPAAGDSKVCAHLLNTWLSSCLY